MCFKEKFRAPDAMMVPEDLMKPTLLLALCLVAFLDGCHRKKPPQTPALAANAESPPSLGLKSSDIKLSDFVAGNQFAVQGRGCKKLEASFWHITADEVHTVTQFTFTKLPDSFEGTLWLITQNGTPFGKKDLKSYSLGEAIPAGTKTQSSAIAPVFQGPYALESSHLEMSSSYEAGREYVVFSRCLVKKVEDKHSFGTGDLEYLKKHAAETKDEIIAVTIRWEK